MARIGQHHPVPGPLRALFDHAPAYFFWSGAPVPSQPLVPGSGIADLYPVASSRISPPTAPAGSAEPVWTGRYLDFLGDDYLAIADQTFSAFTAAGVLLPDFSGGDFPLIGYGTSASDQFTFLRARTNGFVQLGGYDGSTNTYAKASSPITDTNEKPIAIGGAATFSTGEWVEKTYFRSASASGAGTNSRQNADGIQPRDILLGRRYPTGNIGAGRIAAVVFVMGYEAPSHLLHGLTDHLFYRYATLLE